MNDPLELEQAKHADRILRQALDLTRQRRADFLERECSGKPGLRAMVEELLSSASMEQDPLLDLSPGGQAERLQEAEAQLQQDLPYARLGPYKLLREIGRGGMGIVYLAERADGAFEQQVALKLVQRGASVGRQQRFRRERQILASLDHPGIARLLDGGLTDEGQLYLVMEWVDGQSIDRYCVGQALSLHGRLRLFLDVCDAVGAAHRQLVVHRDLKPSNILVSHAGVVKLLDFGIAKLLDPLAESTAPVDPTRVLTPSYASPEQFLGQPITVASDVYQLGQLLYLLLTGRQPFEIQTASMIDAARLICEVVPTKPSAVVLQDLPNSTAPSGESAVVGPLRQGRDPVNTAAWSRALRGDLDNIVAKALAKEPTERYASVDALASDLEHYLDGRPVAARPPTLAYVGGKLISRHRAAVIATVLALFTLVLLVFTHTRQLRQARDRAERALQVAEQSRDEAETLARSLVDFFDLADPERKPSAAVDVLDLLGRSVVQVRSEFAEHPLTRARLLHALGEIYTKLGRLEQAAELVEEALVERQAHLPSKHPTRIESLNQLGVILGRLKRFDEGAALLERALSARREMGDTALQAMTLNNLGNLRWRQGQLDRAEALHRRALALREELDDPIRIGDSANNLGVLLNSQGRSKEAAPYLQRALVAHSMAFGSDHPTTAIALNNLGIALGVLGRWHEAMEHYRRAAVAWRKAYGPTHPRTLRAEVNLANALRGAGRTEESIAKLREVLAVQQTQPEPDRVAQALTLALLGASFAQQGDLLGAEASVKEAIALRQEELGGNHVRTLIARTKLGELWRRQERSSEAEEELRRVVEQLRTSSGEDSTLVAEALHQLGLTLRDRGELAEARGTLQRALEIRQQQFPDEHPKTVATMRALLSINPATPD